MPRAKLRSGRLTDEEIAELQAKQRLTQEEYDKLSLYTPMDSCPNAPLKLNRPRTIYEPDFIPGDKSIEAPVHKQPEPVVNPITEFQSVQPHPAKADLEPAPKKKRGRPAKRVHEGAAVMPKL